MSSIFEIRASGEWLEDDKLRTCVVCPAADEAAILADRGRPEAVAMAAALLDTDAEGFSALRIAASGHPTLVLFPELAFGSGDWRELDALVRRSRFPIILLVGFGFTAGPEIAAGIAAHRTEPSWPPDQFRVRSDGVYNGAWLWIHRPDEYTRCVTILKNNPEQTREKTLGNLANGAHVLKIVTADLVLFPVICFDLIDKGARAPTELILGTLAGHSRVLVAVPMLDETRPSDAWDQSISRLVGNPRKVPTIVLVANGWTPETHHERESDDAWRMRTGAYVDPDVAREPRIAYAHVRWARGGAAALVLREGGEFAACGPLSWLEAADYNRGCWVPNWRGDWCGGAFDTTPRSVEAIEVDRLLVRLTKQWTDYCSAAGETSVAGWIRPEIEKLRKALFAKGGLCDGTSFAAPLLYPEAPGQQIVADALHPQGAALVAGARMIAAIGAVLDEPPARDEHGTYVGGTTFQRRVRVWRASTASYSKLYRRATDLVARGGSVPPMVVVGRGQSGSAPAADWVRSTLNIDAPAPADARAPEGQSRVDIAETREALVYWLPAGDVEDALEAAPDLHTALTNIRALLARSETPRA